MMLQSLQLFLNSFKLQSYFRATCQSPCPKLSSLNVLFSRAAFRFSCPSHQEHRAQCTLEGGWYKPPCCFLKKNSVSFPGASQTGWPDFVCAMGQCCRWKNPKRRFPKGSGGSGRALLGHLPPHNVQPPPTSAVLPLWVLLCQQLSFFLFDFSVDLLRGSFQKTFIHDVYTSYSHIIWAYFIFMYLYLCKNASVHILSSRHCNFPLSSSTTPTCFAFTLHTAQQEDVLPAAGRCRAPIPTQPKDTGGLATCLHIGTFHSQF